MAHRLYCLHVFAVFAEFAVLVVFACCLLVVCLLVVCLLVVCLLSPSPRVPWCWSCIAAMARCGRLVRPCVHPLNELHTCLVQVGSCCCRACACVCVFVFVCYLRTLLCGRVLFGRCCALWCADGACRASSFPYGTRVHCPVHVDARVCICTVRVSAVPPSHCR